MTELLIIRSRRGGRRLAEALAEQLPQRGYRPAYQAGAACPGCGHRAWHVGRQAAECGRCGTALPLAPAETARG